MKRQGLVVAVLVLSLLTACGAADTDTDTDTDTDSESDQPSAEAAAGPYLRENNCSPARSDGDTDDPARRLTQLSHTAGELLVVNGISPGPTVAVGGQLSSDQAADRASTVPGDASIAEALWVAAPRAESNLDPVRDTEEYYAAEAQRIAEFEVTDDRLGQLLGPNWSSVIDVVEGFARGGYERYLEQVRDAPAMRAVNAADMRALLRAEAAVAGLAEQWEAAQSIVGIYFWSCMMSSRDAGSDVDLSSSILGEILAADAVGAAFAESFGSPELVGPLSLGLRIVIDPDSAPSGDERLTRNYDPNEILSEEDVELMEAEEPSLEGP